VNFVSNSSTQFETARLIIKSCDPAYTDGLFQAASQSVSEVYPFLPWCHPDYQRDEAEQWLTYAKAQWQDGSAFGFSIFDRNSSQLIGGCGVSLIDDHPVANLGYWIRSGETGKGLATEATLGLADFAFRQLGLLRLEVIMSIKNPASRKVAINSGAHFEGTLRNRLLLHGQCHDAYLYSLIPDILRL
tara:strand:- start:24748 stop:25311 length:564 start_codon:yes stop_codon:yes gene_type:complete